jgi:hypothetical protein
MFEKIVTAVEPFGLTVVVIAGLVLSGRINVADSDIVGIVTVFVGVSLIIVHVIKQVKTPKTSKRKD